MLRLLLKLCDVTVSIGIHDTEAAGLLHRNPNHRNGRICLVLLVERKHLVVVHLINMVAGEDQNIIRIILIDEVNILRNGICRSAVNVQIGICLFAGRQYIDTAVTSIKAPVLTTCYIGIQ